MPRVEVSTPEAPSAIGPYSQAIAIVGVVTGEEPEPSTVIPGTGQLVEGIENQTERSLLNLTAVLAAAGLSVADVVKTTVFLADMTDFAAMNAVYGRFVADPAPARSTVQVAALPRGGRVEIEAIARRAS